MINQAMVFLAERLEQCLADDALPIQLDGQEAAIIMMCMAGDPTPISLDKEEAELALKVVRKTLDEKK